MEGMENQQQQQQQQQENVQQQIVQEQQQQENVQQQIVQQQQQQQQQQHAHQNPIGIAGFQADYAPQQGIVNREATIVIPHFQEPIQIQDHVIINDYEQPQEIQQQEQQQQENVQQQQQQQIVQQDPQMIRDKKEEMERTTAELRRYGNQLIRLRAEGKISVEQQTRRLEAVLKVKQSETDILLLHDQQDTLKQYQDARDFLAKIKRPAVPPEPDPGSPSDHLTAIGKENEILNRGAADEAVSEKLSAADRWLLSANLQKDETLENSLVFNLLDRPVQERLLAYYLIEKDYQTKISDSEILFFNDPALLARLDKEAYQPNLERLQKKGLDMDKLTQVYRQVCLAGPRMKMMRDLDRHVDRERRDAENEGRQADENVAIVQQQIKIVKEKLYALEDCKVAYENGNWFQKLRLKSRLKKAVNELYEAANDFFLRELHIPGNAEISNVQDWIKGTMLTGNGLKTLGSATAGVMKGFDSLTAATMITSASTNIFGCVLGGVNLIIAVMGILKSYKGFASLTTAAKIAQTAEWCNSLATPLSATTSSVTATVNVFTPASELATKASLATAATAAAGLSLAVGGLTTVVGGYQLGNAIKQGKNAKKAKEELDRIREERWQQEQQQQDDAVLFAQPAIQVERGQLLTENNIFKIQERINKRAKISAACQTASGVCAMAAGAALLTGNSLVALGVGFAGLLTIAGGTIATRLMKKREYEKAVDEYLDLDTLAEERFTERRMALDGELSNSEKKKLKKQLRADMMEMMGFTSVKNFYVHIMQNYASHICTVVYPEILRLNGLNENGMNDEARTFYKLIESMGLKWKVIRNEDDEITGIQPKVEQIARKLLG